MKIDLKMTEIVPPREMAALEVIISAYCSSLFVSSCIHVFLVDMHPKMLQKSNLDYILCTAISGFFLSDFSFTNSATVQEYINKTWHKKTLDAVM